MRKSVGQFGPICHIRLIGLIGLISLIFPVTTFAQGKNVITVSPQLIQLDLSKDPPEAEYSYTNNTTHTIELALSMQDVKELEDRGIPGLINNDEAKNYKYGLSSWASFSNNNVVIAPHETKKVKVFIDKTRLTLGGHYASVLAEIKQNADGKAVKLKAILSSLLFVRSGSGFEIEKATIMDLKVSQEFFSFPKTASFRLTNTGNVDLTPYGILTITDPLKREVARGIVNEGSQITLPDSIRKYTIPVTVKSRILPPGMYKAVLSVNYGKKKVKKEVAVNFVTLGSLNIRTIGATILVGGILCFVLLKSRRRNNPIK